MSIQCPKCGYVRIPEEDKGIPKWECPKCGIVYSKYMKKQTNKSIKKDPDVRRTKTTNIVTANNKLDSVKNKKIVMVSAIVLSFVIGFFAGREHLKYEMRQAMMDAANAFKQNVNEIFQPNTEKNTKVPIKQKQSNEKYLEVSLIQKGYRDFDADIGNQAVTFTLAFTNTLGKDIRAFDGRIIFADLLDNPIKKLKLAYTKPINASETVSWGGEMDYNQFIDSDRSLRSKDVSDLNVTLKLRKVLYADGSKEEF